MGCFRHILALLALSLTLLLALAGYSSEHQTHSDFICDAEMLSCRIADSDMALGDSVGFFDREGKLYAIGEVVGLDAGFRDVEIVQLFSRIADDAQVRVITDSERQKIKLDKHSYRSKHLVGVSFAYKRLALVDSLAGFDYGVYFARRLRDDIAVHVRSSYAYVEGSLTKEEFDTRHDFSVHSVLMSFYPGLTYEIFPRKPLSLFVEAGAGIVAVNTAKPEGVELDEEIGGAHLLLQAMVGLQLNVRSWHLQAGVAQQFVGRKGAHKFTATLAKGI